MDKETLLELNEIIKDFKDLPKTEGYSNMFDGSNVSYTLMRYHKLKGSFYSRLLAYAMGRSIQVEDRTGNVGTKYYILRITEMKKEERTNIFEPSWEVKEEILLWHEDEKVFLEANKKILEGSSL